MKESSFEGVGGLKILPVRGSPTIFYDNAGSTDETLKLYEGHYHDLLNDVDKEFLMADITNWIDARIPATQTKSMGAAVK